ncbi:hypothetical protein ADK57_25930 [Streptomyces sp. MMG1533]|uniref:hypothetical protein n=1 Tax=Streptomyces sp. MMG1533 TaxID=1415546 RepID=UPI0006AF074F|nr:hypothetical protein [Streptomyces sp. MMG1533]KOU62074.1 hypothetical protein ADK57_25930 [Streptomyces sp. MMG1533]
MRLSRPVLIAIGVVSALLAVAVSSAIEELGAPGPATVAAAVGVFYATAYGLANATATFIAYRAARRG